MSTKRILVTGASGFIGQPLVHALVGAGYKVRAAMRHRVPFPDSVEIVIVPDFRDNVDWNPILRGVDIVIHLAGLSLADDRSTGFGAYDKINRMATQDLARAAQDTRLERFVLMSSVRAQVGHSAAQVVSEKEEPRPTDNYGRSKLAAEFALRSFGLPYTILLPVAVYGPHFKGNMRTLIRLASLPLPLPFKALTNLRSFLGLDNLIAATVFVLDSLAAVGEEFLVADSVPLTLPEIFTMLREAKGRRPGLVHFPPQLIQFVLCTSGQRNLWERVSENLVVDTSKLESLGWSPKVETYQGFRAALFADKGR